MDKKLKDLSPGDKFQWNRRTWTVVYQMEKGVIVWADPENKHDIGEIVGFGDAHPHPAERVGERR